MTTTFLAASLVLQPAKADIHLTLPIPTTALPAATFLEGLEVRMVRVDEGVKVARVDDLALAKNDVGYLMKAQDARFLPALDLQPGDLGTVRLLMLGAPENLRWVGGQGRASKPFPQEPLIQLPPPAGRYLAFGRRPVNGVVRLPFQEVPVFSVFHHQDPPGVFWATRQKTERLDPAKRWFQALPSEDGKLISVQWFQRTNWRGLPAGKGPLAIAAMAIDPDDRTSVMSGSAFLLQATFDLSRDINAGFKGSRADVQEAGKIVAEKAGKVRDPEAKAYIRMASVGFGNLSLLHPVVLDILRLEGSLMRNPWPDRGAINQAEQLNRRQLSLVTPGFAKEFFRLAAQAKNPEFPRIFFFNLNDDLDASSYRHLRTYALSLDIKDRTQATNLERLFAGIWKAVGSPVLPGRPMYPGVQEARRWLFLNEEMPKP